MPATTRHSDRTLKKPILKKLHVQKKLILLSIKQLLSYYSALFENKTSLTVFNIIFISKTRDQFSI